MDFLMSCFHYFLKSDPIYKYVKGSYPLYHSSYETFKLVNDYIDPGFKVDISNFNFVITKLFYSLS